LLVTVNTRLKFEIEIVHDLSCHPVLQLSALCGATVHNIFILEQTEYD